MVLAILLGALALIWFVPVVWTSASAAQRIFFGFVVGSFALASVLFASGRRKAQRLLTALATLAAAGLTGYDIWRHLAGH